MKTGMILYVVGDEPDMFDIGLEAEHARQVLGVDQVEIVAKTSGHFDIHDAWWRLTARGMKSVKCLTAEFQEGTGLKPMARELRLCG